MATTRSHGEQDIGTRTPYNIYNAPIDRAAAALQRHQRGSARSSPRHIDRERRARCLTPAGAGGRPSTSSSGPNTLKDRLRPNGADGSPEDGFATTWPRDPRRASSARPRDSRMDHDGSNQPPRSPGVFLPKPAPLLADDPPRPLFRQHQRPDFGHGIMSLSDDRRKG